MLTFNEYLTEVAEQPTADGTLESSNKILQALAPLGEALQMLQSFDQLPENRQLVRNLSDIIRTLTYMHQVLPGSKKPMGSTSIHHKAQPILNTTSRVR